MPYRRALLSLLSLLACAVTVSAAPPKKAPQKQKLSAIDAKLQAIFQKADENADGYLDATELAHSYRGSKAKAASPAYDDMGNLTSAGKSAATKYPDMVFLGAADKDNDGRVSWQEFKQYGEAAVQALQGQLAQRQRAIQASYGRAMRNMRSSRGRSGRTVRRRNQGNRNGNRQAAQAQRQAAQQQRAVQAAAIQAQQQARAQQQRVIAAARAQQQALRRAQQAQAQAIKRAQQQQRRRRR